MIEMDGRKVEEMENIMELIILIVFLLLGALGSLTNQQNGKKSKGLDWDTPPPQKQTKVPPLTPVNQPGKVWGEAPPMKDEMASTAQEPVLQRKRKLEKRAQRPQDEAEPRPIPPSAPVPPFVTAAPPKPLAQSRSMLEEIFREAFNVDELFERTPEKPIPEFYQPEKPSLEAQPAPAHVPQKRVKPKPAAAVSARPMPPVLVRLAREAEVNPLRSVIIFSEILRRPVPIVPMHIPKKRTPADHAS